MYVIIAGAGKVGWNLARELIDKQNEVTAIENDRPRYLQHFQLLGIHPAVSATDLILRLIEHEVPQYGLVHLLDLAEERLEIIELIVNENAPIAGRRVGDLDMP